MPASAARRASKPDSSAQPNDGGGRGHIQVAEEAHGATASPARALQARLEQNLQIEHTGEARWPLYAALSFWGGVSALMWAALIGCVWVLVRHI
ncbi:MAG: hypothetical protein ACXWK1_07160 [Caulobacteraceae bacterium]